MQERTILLISADDCGWSDLRAVLHTTAGVRLVGEATSAREVRRLAATAAPAPDVVIAAARVEGASALPLFTAIREEYWPAVRLLVFAPRLDPGELLAFADLGVRQYLLWRDLPPRKIRHDLALVLTADIVLHSGAVATAFMDEIRRYRRLAGAQASPVPPPAPPRQAGDTPRVSLTPREHEVLRLIDAGRSNKEIAAALSVSSRTAEFHVQNVLEKLEAHSRIEALRCARRQGLLPPAGPDDDD